MGRNDNIAYRSGPAALRRIRELAAESVNVVFTQHAKRQMRTRTITPPQVIDVLRLGSIVEGPALDAYGCWKCTMRRFAAGETTHVAVALCDSELVVITAY